MADRQTILTRIRAALSPSPGTPGGGRGEGIDGIKVAGLPVLADVRPWLPTVGATSAEWLSQFTRAAGELRAEVIKAESVAAAIDAVRALAAADAWPRVASHRSPLTNEIVPSLALPTLWTDDAFAATDLEQCAAGITACDALIAQTGSVLVTARSAGGRALSVYPPHHVVLATADQIVRDLPDAFALLQSKYGPDYPSMMSLITGPSRTGDIERVIVLGAHGPRRLTIVIIDDV